MVDHKGTVQAVTVGDRVHLMHATGQGDWVCIGTASRDDSTAPQFFWDADHPEGGTWFGVWEWVEACVWTHRVHGARAVILALGPLVTPAEAYDRLYVGAADVMGRMLLDAARAMLQDEGVIPREEWER